MATGKVPITSELKRKSWLKSGLVEGASVSFWQTYTGSNPEAIIYQETDISKGDGHTVVFDFSGRLTGKAIGGDNQAYGKGEIKRKFSTKIDVAEFTIPVDNGKKFDGVDIGDLSINEHSDSRSKLADLWIRWRDQGIFDVAQGAIGTVPSHIFSLGTTFDYNSLLKIEDAAKTGKGFKEADANGIVSTTDAKRRAPMNMFKTQYGNAQFLCIIDSYMALKLKSDSSYQTIVINADVRGNNNRTISGIVGKLGSVIYVEAGDFFGVTDGAGAFTLLDSEVEFAGLRKYRKLADDSMVWEGQEAYETADLATSTTYSRGLLLGAGAIQVAMGMMPDYKIQFDQNFSKTSQSAMEYWMNIKKTNLTVDAGKDYKSASITDLDFGVIAVDLEHA